MDKYEVGMRVRYVGLEGRAGAPEGTVTQVCESHITVQWDNGDSQKVDRNDLTAA